MSEPNTPATNSDDAENPASNETEPIDVSELLDSTAKLFEPEDIQRAMAQAGYTPGGGSNDDTVPEPLNADTIEDSSGSDTPDDQATATSDDGGEEPLGSEDESAETPATPRNGFNVLSVVALVLVIALSPLAVIFGYLALGQARRANQRGETLALWAIGLGWVVVAVWLVVAGGLVWIGWEQGITLESLQELIELFGLP